jgi:hypothetical protein
MKPFARHLFALASLVAAALLITPASAHAQSPDAARQKEVVSQLLKRNAARIQHQLNYINRQDFFNNLFQRIRPGNPGREAALCNLLTNIVERFNGVLNPAKFKLISALAQLEQAIEHLANQATPGSPLAAFVKQAQQTFAEQLQEANIIIQRPPATPECPSQLMAAGFPGLTRTSNGTVRAETHTISRTVRPERTPEQYRDQLREELRERLREQRARRRN